MIGGECQAGLGWRVGLGVIRHSQIYKYQKQKVTRFYGGDEGIRTLETVSRLLPWQGWHFAHTRLTIFVVSNRPFLLERALCSGKTSAFQADDAGSIPAARSSRTKSKYKAPVDDLRIASLL